MLIYFSATGNSRYCARTLARLLDDQAVDCLPCLRSGAPAALHSDAPWVFVAPTYAWQLPRVFTSFLRGSTFTGSRDAWFVMTCGSDAGAPGKQIRALCRQLGLRCRGTLPVVMPENYIAMFNAPGPDRAREIIAAARPVLDRAAAAIRAGQDFPPLPVRPLGRLKSGPVNALFYRFYVKATPFTVSDACTGCGKCVRACPLTNISLAEGRPVWGDRCTHCMACICGCPASAIEYGRASRGKPRYQCPLEPD